MKKVLLTVCIILVALTIMAPNPEKAERLKVNGQDWDSASAQFTVALSCQFGAATAGEHADFQVAADLTVIAAGKSYELAGARDITKVEGAEKDDENFISIEPLSVDWPEGKDFEGVASVTTSASLFGPGGNVQGDAVVSTGHVLVNIPGSPDVMVDSNNWDYDPKFGIIVPLVANANIVDLGYKVTVEVKVNNADGSLAGAGEGSADVVKIDEQDSGYVQIKPVFAPSVYWNGDDDGSGEVTGTITLTDFAGNLISKTTFEQLAVEFEVHTSPCEACAPPES